MPRMKSLLYLSAFFCALPLISCSTSEMATVAARVQEARQHNAASAQSARIRIWRDISTYNKQGWHLHSEQASRLTMPDDEFQEVRRILMTSGYTTWRSHDDTPLPPKSPLPTSIVELEWLDGHGTVSGGISISKVCRESELDTKTNSVFPFVLPDDAYNEFMALPTISKAINLSKSQE